MKNISSMGLLWMWQSQIRKMRVTHNNTARHALPWDMTFSHVLMKITPCRLVKCYGRFGGTLPSSWTVDPEDEVKLTGQQGGTFQMTWIFTNTAVRISQPPTAVPKRRQETTKRRCLKSQRSADLIYTALKVWNHANVEVLCFLQSARQENAQTEVGRVFSLWCCSCICWSFQIKENYPTTGKGQEEIGWNPSLVEAGCDEISQLRTEGWTLHA